MWQVWLETPETARTGDMRYVASASSRREAIQKATKIKREHPSKIVQIQKADGDAKSVALIELAKKNPKRSRVNPGEIEWKKDSPTSFRTSYTSRGVGKLADVSFHKRTGWTWGVEEISPHPRTLAYGSAPSFESAIQKASRELAK